MEEKDATARASELMKMKMCDLPKACYEYAKKLCKMYGGCGEVLFTAYSHYANHVEGLPCDDDAYRATAIAVEFFNSFEEEGKP